MNKVITCLLVLCIGISACRKNGETVKPNNGNKPDSEKTSPVAITNGSLSGMIAPLGSVTMVTLTSATIPAQTALPNSISGSYKFTDLVAGNYVIHFAVAKGYTAPDEVEITIEAGKNTDAGWQTLVNSASKAPFSFWMDGKLHQFGALVKYSSPALSIQGIRSEGQYGRLDYKRFTITINLDEVNGPGTYVCKGTSTSSITYVSEHDNSIGYRTWGMNKDGGSATVIITSIDPVNRKVTGTFTANLIPISGTSGDKIIADGILQ